LPLLPRPYPTRRSSDLRQPPLPLQVRHQNPPGFTDIRGKGERLMMEDRILREQSIAVSAGSRLPRSLLEEGGAKTARHAQPAGQDRKSTRLNSSHVKIS